MARTKKKSFSSELTMDYVGAAGELLHLIPCQMVDARKNLSDLCANVTKEPVVLTSHDKPRAVLISIDDFQSLVSTQQSKLQQLTHRYDDLVARMQTDQHRQGADASILLSGEDLGRHALKVAGGSM